MPLPPELESAYRQWWGLAQTAAQARDDTGKYAYTVTDLVSAAADIARTAGQAISFATGSAISRLFGLARGADRASTRLTRAGEQEAIDASMLTAWPTSASLDVQAVTPEYMAKGQFTYTNAIGEQAFGWVTLTGMNQLPITVGNLRLRMQGAALSQYTRTKSQGGSPTTDAETMTVFGDFTRIELWSL